VGIDLRSAYAELPRRRECGLPAFFSRHRHVLHGHAARTEIIVAAVGDRPVEADGAANVILEREALLGGGIQEHLALAIFQGVRRLDAWDFCAAQIAPGAPLGRQGRRRVGAIQRGHLPRRRSRIGVARRHHAWIARSPARVAACSVAAWRFRLAGQGGELIVGATAFDANDAALNGILAEWTSARDYATRVANIKGAGSGPRNNGSYFLTADGPSVTAFDDAAEDILTGSAGADWFFANLDAGVKDKITDLSAQEFANDLDFIGP